MKRKVYVWPRNLYQLPGLKGTEGGWVLVGLSPTVTTGSYSAWSKTILLQNQWHQATDTWPECCCCLSLSTLQAAVEAWPWGWSGDGFKNVTQVYRARAQQKQCQSLSSTNRSQTLGSWKKISDSAFALCLAVLNSLFAFVEISQGIVGWLLCWVKIEMVPPWWEQRACVQSWCSWCAPDHIIAL